MNVEPIPKPGKRPPKNKRPPNPQKQQRLVNPAAVEEVRSALSEISGEPTHGAAPHHIWGVGIGGPDHVYNLIQTTGGEHVATHAGKYTRDYLLGIVAERTGKTVDYLKCEIFKMMGRG